MIEIRGLCKRFGARAAVEGLDLDVPRGAICGLLGHNGAGKSTTLGCLLGHVYPDAGSVRVGGVDALRERGRALARVGAIFEAPQFYEYLSGARNLRMLAELTGPVDAAAMARVVELVGLTGRIGDRVGRYSHGMRQRLALAQALVHGPELLILDEPTDGLDPAGIHEMRELVRGLNREHGLTILLSSHLLGEVRQLCTHIAVMRQARLVFAGRMADVPAEGRRVTLRARDRAGAVARLLGAGLIVGEGGGDAVRLADGVAVEDIARAVIEGGHGLEAVTPVEASLEAFYLSVAGEAS